ncbi:hypothetical protein HK098_004945 [Nowakowskiella sp. JEL0407]|nr:hypothetical protein HK098_004945 [Nowakowskiella sp. JEL0407]
MFDTQSEITLSVVLVNIFIHVYFYFVFKYFIFAADEDESSNTVEPQSTGLHQCRCKCRHAEPAPNNGEIFSSTTLNASGPFAKKLLASKSFIASAPDVSTDATSPLFGLGSGSPNKDKDPFYAASPVSISPPSTPPPAQPKKMLSPIWNLFSELYVVPSSPKLAKKALSGMKAHAQVVIKFADTSSPFTFHLSPSKSVFPVLATIKTSRPKPKKKPSWFASWIYWLFTPVVMWFKMFDFTDEELKLLVEMRADMKEEDFDFDRTPSVLTAFEFLFGLWSQVLELFSDLEQWTSDLSKDELEMLKNIPDDVVKEFEAEYNGWSFVKESLYDVSAFVIDLFTGSDANGHATDA